jgi:hypothetical protein
MLNQRDEAGNLSGDVDFGSVEPVSPLPVPGGVGTVTTAFDANDSKCPKAGGIKKKIGNNYGTQQGSIRPMKKWDLPIWTNTDR